ncbi:MAG: S41 family peptidase [Planctomycetaceae bacterium]|nr:S41 family peptidase [Planctomycetaceae bacterium]
MKTTSHNSLTRLFQVLFTLFSLCIAIPALAEEPQLSISEARPETVTAHKPVSTKNTFEFTTDNNNQNRPLPREDVIPRKTAVRTGVSPAAPTFNNTNYNTPSYGTPTYDAPTSAPLGNSKPVDPQAEISGRFSDSKMLNFLSRTNMQQLASVYIEASQMIDSRHVSPASYQQRVQGAIQDVINALQNETFLRANGANVRPDQIQTVQNELWSMVQNQPPQTANEAVGIMQFAANLVNSRLGVRREAVALEFLNGTIDSLDKYSAFLPEAAGYDAGAELELTRTAGLEENIVGVGIELQQHDLGVELVGVIENSPASELGLREGDIIIAVDGQSMAGQNLNAIADRIGGRQGSTVTVDILRDGKKYRGTMVRRAVYVGSVSGTKMVDDQNKIGYVKLKQFSESSAEDLEKALWTLHRQGMKGLILDLRGNPGGLLDESIDVANLFLPGGTIVSTKGRNTSDNTSESASYDKTWATPMVVLVDENSASASEILAAAIQENQRGVVVGRNSYGKGTVQTHFPMRTVPAILKLTTAKFYSPNGREMADSGVRPDVPVQQTSTGYRGVQNDADIQTGIQVMLQGTPSDLVARSSQNRRQTGQSLQAPSFPQLPMSIFNN